MSDQHELPPGWDDDQGEVPQEPAPFEAPRKLTKALSPETPIGELLARYIEVKSKIRAKSTITTYASVITAFARHVGGTVTAADLTDENLASFFVLREKQVQRNTVNSEGATLLAFTRWCAGKRLCDMPDVSEPERIKKRPQALTQAQLRDLFAAAIEFPGDFQGVKGSLYFYGLFCVLWQTGERIGAVMALTWEQIDLKGGFITYPPATRKFGQQELVRPISETGIKALKALREASPDKPFPGGLTRLYPAFHIVRSAAGLPDWVTPHTVRKSVASHLPTLEDARQMLGHSTSKITAKNYRDDRMEDTRELLSKLPNVEVPERRFGLWSALFGGAKS